MLNHQRPPTFVSRYRYGERMPRELPEWARQAVLLGVLAAVVAVLSFAVIGESPEERFIAKLCRPLRGQSDVRAEVFMRVNATDAEIAGVRDFLDSSRLVKSYKFLDKAAALTEFKRIFRKDPDLVRNITAEALPTSFRVVPKDSGAVRPIEKQSARLPGVDDVATPNRALIQLCSDR